MGLAFSAQALKRRTGHNRKGLTAQEVQYCVRLPIKVYWSHTTTRARSNSSHTATTRQLEQGAIAVRQLEQGATAVIQLLLSLEIAYCDSSTYGWYQGHSRSGVIRVQHLLVPHPSHPLPPPGVGVYANMPSGLFRFSPMSSGLFCFSPRLVYPPRGPKQAWGRPHPPHPPTANRQPPKAGGVNDRAAAASVSKIPTVEKPQRSESLNGRKA